MGVKGVDQRFLKRIFFPWPDKIDSGYNRKIGKGEWKAGTS
jgi:hypothetical protein